MPKKFVRASVVIDWNSVSQEVEKVTKMNYMPGYLRNVWTGLVRSSKIKKIIETIIGSELQEVSTVVDLVNK